MALQKYGNLYVYLATIGIFGPNKESNSMDERLKGSFGRLEIARELEAEITATFTYRNILTPVYSKERIPGSQSSWNGLYLGNRFAVRFFIETISHVHVDPNSEKDALEMEAVNTLNITEYLDKFPWIGLPLMAELIEPKRSKYFSDAYVALCVDARSADEQKVAAFQRDLEEITSHIDLSRRTNLAQLL